MTANRIALKNQDTYVYIDVSNIRWACIKTLGFRIDFVRLLNYFKKKYPNLKEVRYYEGIARGDEKKRRMFDFLEKQGYTICRLERKAYASTEIVTQEVECPECGCRWQVESRKSRVAMKSNVDVYLASDMVARASVVDHPVRFILVSCDGDYAEAIKNIVRLNKNVSVGVLATPYTSEVGKNTLSVRLQEVYREIEIPRYMLHDINSIRACIEADSGLCNANLLQ